MHGTVWLWRWRRNPLRRRSDVVEAWVGLVAGAVLAVGAPLSGVTAADAMHDSLARAAHERHRTVAVLERDAPSAERVRSEGLDAQQVRTEVRWTTADGAGRTAKVVVAPGLRAGSQVPIWLDPSGRLTDPPLGPAQAAVQADLMGAGAAVAFGVVTLAGHRVVRADLDRRRRRQWGREWERVGPRWSRGRHA